MKIVFFIPKILRDSHRYIYNFDRFEAEGLDFAILDATIFYGNVATTTENIILQNRYIIRDKEDFDNFNQTLPKESILYVIKDHDLNYSSRELKKIIRKNDIILSYNTKTFATLETPPKWRTLIEKSVRKLAEVLPLHFLKYYYSIFYNIPLPDYYLCSTSYLLPLKAYLTVKPANRFSVHADDMNHIINEPSERFVEEGKKLAVFLDQGIPFLHKTHPGVYKDSFPEEYLDNYYSNLMTTFSHIKKTSNIDEIIVALHPDAVVFEKELYGKFPGIQTIIGKTKDLIREADLVLAHNSTSINFAVYYEKPVLIFKDDLIYNYHPRVKKLFDFYTGYLNMNSIYIDKNLQDQQAKPFIDRERYQLYKNRYIKDNHIQENSYYYAINRILKTES
ncbi:hypothetical protein [Salegentibacter flavus]|uniref:CDP-Glycerol:Poly(Glycerophosphate) glycerophosphotransferase n=1 Tax=Salegentibacter flavus TaxID=287099 RepID=A0A1I5BG59_9FLAO|nr:hypothetical protein [Salegentibacter flavus]SFN73713.1 hypothetical protein SAMN05660413_02363 [Salegentibacter flavus]